MPLRIDDTIAAIASPAGGGVRGILRVTGPDAPAVAASICDPAPVLPQRAARRIDVKIPVANGNLSLDAALFVWPTARSFTGQPVVELHLPGSPPLLNEVLQLLFARGARPAEPGEFTLRAFLSGKVDLVQAEAVLGVIDASSTGQLRTALMQLSGGISQPLANLREELLIHLADLEAGLDFVEEDLDFVSRSEFESRLREARDAVGRLLAQAANRTVANVSPRVVLAGLPNAGKSTLFNRLAEGEQALVSDIAGTTRDYLTAGIHCGAMEVELVDTAGWDDAGSDIDSAAATLRHEQFARGDLIVWCSAVDASPQSQKLDAEFLGTLLSRHRRVLHVGTKADCAVNVKNARQAAGDDNSTRATLPPAPSLKREGEKDADAPAASHRTPLRVSARTGEGIEQLRDAIAAALSTDAAGSEIIATTAARCEESLLRTGEGVERCLALLAAGAGDELLALELREVLDHLGRITGQVYTDDILDRIFSRFCIGK